MGQSPVSESRGSVREALAAVRSIPQLVTDPEEFLRRQVDSATIRWEVALVLLVGSLSLPGIYRISTLTEGVVDSETFTFAFAGRMARPLVIVMLLWVGYSLAFHVLANRFRGRGPPGRLLRGTAWALLPLGLGNLVRSAAMVLVSSGLNVEAVMTGRSASEQLGSVLDAVVSEPIVVATTVLFLLLLVWSGYLMTYVVQVGKDVDRRTAVKVVVVPVGLHALGLLFALVDGSVNASMLV
jgi:hypothetical protein